MMNILRQAQDERVSELYTFVGELKGVRGELEGARSELEDAPVVSLSNRCRSARTGRPHPTVIRPVVI